MNSVIGRVIRILDEYHVIVDAGKNALNKGDAVEIIEANGEVIDLDGNDLGEFVLVKDSLNVIQVEEKYSICEKNETVKIKKLPISEIALSPLLRETTYTKRIPLNINGDISLEDHSFDLSIKLGDLVRKA